MLPQLVGFAIFGAIVTWTQSLGQEGKSSESELVDKKSPKRNSYPNPLEVIRDTSDPEQKEHTPEDPGPPVDTKKAVQDLADTLCRQAMACPEIPPEMTWQDCLDKVQANGYIANQFGISSRLSFQKVIDGEGLGYTIGAKDFERCSNEVKNLPCENLLTEEIGFDFGLPDEPGEGDGGIQEKKITRISPRFDPDGPSACREAFEPEPVSCEISQTPLELTHPAVQRLVDVLCSSMATCHPGLECQPCFDRSLSNHRFADKIGLNRVNLQEIDFGLGLGLYLVNEDNLNQCLLELENLECSRIPSNPYGLHQMIPRDSKACERIFEKPKETCEVETQDPLTAFARSMCETIITCRPEIACDFCIDQVMASSAVASALGLKKVWLQDGENLSLQGVETYLQQGRITLDTTALEQCASDIDEQTCLKIQLGPGNFRPQGFRPLISGVMGLFQGGTGSCEMALNNPDAVE